MALCKTSNAIVSIRGRFGGVYFKHGPDGQHIQAWPRVWNYPRTPAQKGAWGYTPTFASVGIDGFSGAAALWFAALCAAFASLWAIFAVVYYFKKVGEPSKKINGYLWYMHFALAFPDAQRPPFWKPPNAPRSFPNFLVLWKGTTTYKIAPKDWPPDCCTGYYYKGVPYNGKLTYHSDDFLWFLWWDPPLWVVTTGVGFKDPPTTYYGPAGEVTGTYHNPVTGKFSNVHFGCPEERLLPH